MIADRQTHTHTDTLITILRCPIGGGVTNGIWAVREVYRRLVSHARVWTVAYSKNAQQRHVMRFDLVRDPTPTLSTNRRIGLG